MRKNQIIVCLLFIIVGLLGCSKSSDRFHDSTNTKTTQSQAISWHQVIDTPQSANEIAPQFAIKHSLNNGLNISLFPLNPEGTIDQSVGQYLNITNTTQTRAINDLLSITRGGEAIADFTVKIALNSTLYQNALYFFIGYDETKIHPVFANRSSHLPNNVAMLAILDQPGSAGIGFTTLGPGNLSVGDLVEIGFANGAQTQRKTSLAATNSANAVTINAAKGTENGSVTLSWQEINKGDCSNNGVVDFADFGKIGLHYGKDKNKLTADQLVLYDTDGKGKVDFADFGIVGANYGAKISGYQILRIPAVKDGTYTEGDFLASKAPKSGVDVLPNLGTPPVNDKISIDRGTVVPESRIVYTYVDKPASGGYYAYLVRPYSSSNDSQPWGVSSLIAVTEIQATALVFETDKSIYDTTSDKQVLLKVKLLQAKDIFSVNVRFSYESALLKLVSIDKVDGADLNFFKDTTEEPLLFMGTEIDPLSLGTIGVNATLPGTLSDSTPKDGVIAYIRFDLIPGSTGKAKFIFPVAQAGSFIYIKTKVGATLENIPPFTIGDPLEIEIK